MVLLEVNNPGHIYRSVTMVSTYDYEIALHVCSSIPLQSESSSHKNQFDAS